MQFGSIQATKNNFINTLVCVCMYITAHRLFRIVVIVPKKAVLTGLDDLGLVVVGVAGVRIGGVGIGIDGIGDCACNDRST